MIYLSILFVLIVLPLIVWATRTYYRPASCFDNKMNQGESDIDCGGPCTKLCKAESLEPIVHWARIFRVSDGLYTAAIMVENPNDSARATDMKYRIKVIDPAGVPILDREGKASVDPKEYLAIIEPQIFTDKSTAVTIQFEWISDFNWERKEAAPLAIEIRNLESKNVDTQPEITASLYNPTLKVYKDFFAAVIVYGKDGNAIAASETYIEELRADEMKDIFYTWPQPFGAEIGEIEILPQI